MLSIIENKEEIKEGDIIVVDAATNKRQWCYLFSENDNTILRKGIVAIRVIKIWDDIETGFHYKGEILKDNPIVCEEAKEFDYSTFSEFDDIYKIIETIE